MSMVLCKKRRLSFYIRGMNILIDCAKYSPPISLRVVGLIPAYQYHYFPLQRPNDLIY